MDYKKKYNEALKRARELVAKWTGKNRDFYVEDYSYIFPELRESEDERIRKAIVHLLDVASEAYLVEATGFKKEQFLSYLEKQKEQKPAEWSEEDEKKIHFLSRLIEFQVKDGEYCFGEGACAISKQEAIEMLKSLCPQPHWKPSEEQMRQLCDAAHLKAKISDDIYVFPELRSLYYDIQKLTEK